MAIELNVNANTSSASSNFKELSKSASAARKSVEDHVKAIKESQEATKSMAAAFDLISHALNKFIVSVRLLHGLRLSSRAGNLIQEFLGDRFKNGQQYAVSKKTPYSGPGSFIDSSQLKALPYRSEVPIQQGMSQYVEAFFDKAGNQRYRDTATGKLVSTAKALANSNYASSNVSSSMGEPMINGYPVGASSSVSYKDVGTPVMLKNFLKFGIVIAAIIAAIVVLVASIIMAAKKTKEFADTMAVAGTTSAEAYGLMRIGGAVGMSGSEVGSSSVGIQKALFTGQGPGAAILAKYGVHGGNPFYDADSGESLIRSVVAMTKMSRQEAVLTSRSIPELQKYMPLVQADAMTRNAFAASTTVSANSSAYFDLARKTFGGTTEEQTGANFQVASGGFWDSIKELFTTIGKPFVDVLSALMTALTPVIQGLNFVLKIFVVAFIEPMIALIKWVISIVQKFLGFSFPDFDLSLKNNANAMDRFTKALDNGREMYGLGERGRKAIPAAFRGQMADEYLGNAKKSWGAFSF